MVSKKYDISKAQLQRLLEANMSLYEIADMFGCSRSYIGLKVKEYGLKATNRRKKEALDRKLLIEENHTNRLTLKQISRKYNRSYASIKHMFRKFDIEVRDNVSYQKELDRKKIFESIDLQKLYQTHTKVEIQKKLGVGQEYLDKELGDTESPFSKKSSYEIRLIESIKERDNSIEIIPNSKSVISPLEIDIMIPSKNLGIEINGLYWHSSVHKDKRYHKKKTEMCESKGVKLIQFFEDEWLEKNDICKSIVFANLGLVDRVYARNCTIVQLESTKSSTFFSENHLKKNARSSVCYGLEYNGNIVCAMSFGQNRFGEGWELIRFCNQTNLTVVGGASKIFKHFVKYHQPESIISYADRRISCGKLYQALGFKFIKNTDVGFCYVVGKSRSNRMNWQRHKLKDKLPNFDPNKTEQQNMIEHGFYPIYDSGNKLYKWQ